MTAGEEQKGVAIDEKNFPDEGFRNYVKYFDESGDGYLSDDEIGNVTSLDIYDSAEGATIQNLKGIELFSNLEEVEIENCSVEIIDFSKCGNLKNVSLYYCGEVKSVNVSGCKKLTDLSITYSNELNTINLDACSNLERIQISGADITSLNLKACKDTLSTLNLKNCEKLKDVDMTGCKKLEDISFYGCDNMEEIDVDLLKKQWPELKCLELSSLSKQKIDLTGFEKLYSFSIGDGTVESIKFDPKQKFVGIDIDHNEIKELDLDGRIVTDMEDDSPEIYIQRQTPTITITEDKVKNNTVALSDLFSDASRVTIKKGSGYTYDDSTKTITFKSAKNMKFNYVWDTKYEGEKLYGTANIVVEDSPKPSQPETKINTITQVKLAATKYTYDGKAKTPAVSVYAGKTKLNASNYTVTYPTNRKDIGNYQVKVVGKADQNCRGTVTATYQIVPKTVKTPTVKAGKKKVTIKWSKVTGGVKYQVAIAKKGGKYKNYTVRGTTKTIKKLTSKKNYQVKVRAYKKVGTKTYYGSWSKTKTVKVK